MGWDLHGKLVKLLLFLIAVFSNTFIFFSRHELPPLPVVRAKSLMWGDEFIYGLLYQEAL